MGDWSSIPPRVDPEQRPTNSFHTSMTTVPTPEQYSFLQANLVPPGPVTTRCKKCGVPLPDSTWKNCDRCRRNRTESYHRWKRSVLARQSILNDSGSTLLSTPISTIQYPSAPPPTSNPNPPSTTTHVTTAPNPGFSTFSSQAPSLSAPLQHYPSGPDHSKLQARSSQTTSDEPRTAPALVAPQTIHVPEFQWSDELIDQLLALPPRSRYVGKFSVIADPAVDNTRRAQMFAGQLRARGMPISCVRPPRVSTFPLL